MTERAQVQCGAVDRDGKRVVVATLGSRQHVDKFDVADNFRRSKFINAAIARLRLPEDAVEWLDGEILDAADAEDEYTSSAIATANVVKLSTVKPKPISWHWDRTIPRGAVTYIFGDAGEGKSQLATDIVSRRSRGASMPPHDLPGDDATTSLILTCEDDIERTVVPRLLATGADVSRVLCLRDVTPLGSSEPRMAQLPTDLNVIEGIIRDNAVDTVVVDVFTGFLAEGLNPNSDSEMRAVMARINRVAVDTQSTWLLLGHPNKREGAKSHYRAGGSVAILAASRAGFAVGQDPEDPLTKAFCPVKFNLGPRPHSLTFTIEPVGDVSRIRWGGQTELSASEVLGAGHSSKPGPKGEKTETAKDIITDILAGGPRGSNEVLQACLDAGLSERTYWNARKQLGVKAEKTEFNGNWLLTLNGSANGHVHDDF